MQTAHTVGSPDRPGLPPAPDGWSEDGKWLVVFVVHVCPDGSAN